MGLGTGFNRSGLPFFGALFYAMSYFQARGILSHPGYLPVATVTGRLARNTYKTKRESMLRKACILSLGLFAISADVLAHDYQQGNVIIEHPWSRPTPPGTPVGVGYMTIHNEGDEAVTLVSGQTPVAERLSIHETSVQDGLMKMRPLADGLTIPAGGTVMLKPHSYHLMLEELDQPLREGDLVPLSLIFDGLEPIDVQLKVQQSDDAPAVDHSGHQGHSSGHSEQRKHSDH